MKIVFFITVALTAVLCVEGAINAAVDEVTTSSVSFTWISGGDSPLATLQNQEDEQDRREQPVSEHEFKSLKSGVDYVLTISSPGQQDWSSVFTTARCPTGWEGLKNSCYKRIENAEDKEQAENECRAIFPSAHLANPRNAQEFQFITSSAVLATDSSRLFWIGITIKGGNEIYSDGTNVTDEVKAFRFPEETDNHECVALNPGTGNWTWLPTQCAVPAHFICEYPVTPPPRHIEVHVTTTSARVAWQPPEPRLGSNFSHYIAELHEDTPVGSSLKSVEVAANKTEFVFTNLRPGFLYFASVLTEHDNGGARGARLPGVPFITKPLSPTGFNADPGYDHIYYYWDGIDYEDEGDDDTYSKIVITYTDGKEQRSIDIPSKWDDYLYNIDPYTDYHISAVFVSIYSTPYASLEQRSDEVTVDVRTHVSPVFHLHVPEETLSETGFTAVWDPALGRVDNYEAYIWETDELMWGQRPWGVESISIDSAETKYTFTDLDPGKTYQVDVITKAGWDESETESLAQTTRPLPLDEWRIQPRNQDVDFADFKTGNAPTDLTNVFDGYRLEFRNKKSDELIQRDFGRDSRFLVVDELTPGSEYDVLAYSKSKGVLSNPPHRMNVSLKVAAPQDFQFTTRNETSLTLGWTSSKGEVTSYLITCDVCPGNDAEVIRFDEGNELVFHNLNPGNPYTFTIQARNEDRPSQTIKYTTRTMPNAPQPQKVEDRNKTTVLVQWPPVSGTKEGYVVEYVPVDGLVSTVTPQEGSVYVPDHDVETISAYVSDLTPGISYTGNVRTVVEDTYSRPSNISFNTQPNEVRSIQEIECEEYSCYISWTPGEGGYEFFDVEVTLLQSGEDFDSLPFVPTRRTAFNLTDLKHSAFYVVQIQTIASNGEKALPVKKYFQTMPLSVSDVKISEVTETSFTVGWNPPEPPYDGFLVILSNEKVEEKFSTKAFVTFDNLLPGALYDLEIFSTYNETKSYSVTQNVTLYPEPPVGLISTGTSSTSLSISWEKEAGVVGSYFLTATTNDGTTLSEDEIFDQSITLTGLTPGVTYDIDVYSRSHGNVRNSRSAGSISLTTDEDYPGQPNSFSVAPQQPARVELSWMEPTEPNGIILQYIIRYRQFYPHVEEDYTYKNISALSITLESLEPGAYYEVSVRAQNSKGEGNWTELTSLQNVESVPGPVSNLVVEATEMRTLTVSWEVPSSPNGEILKYTLAAREKDGTETKNISFMRDPRFGPLKCFEHDEPLAMELFGNFVAENVTGEENMFESLCPVSYDVEGLSPYTDYEITVRAHTRKGAGVIAATSAKTLEERPSGPPRNITVIDVGPNFISLQWDPPKYPNGLLAYEFIFLEKERGTSGETSETSITFSDLTPFSVFAVTMVSETAAGSSNETDWLLLNTTQDVPGKPQNLSGKVMNSESAYLTWSSPNDARGIVTHYEIAIRDVNTGKFLREDIVKSVKTNSTEIIGPALAAETEQNENIPPDQYNDLILGSKIPNLPADTLTTIVKDLRPYTQYEFQVRAVTSAGAGSPAHLTLTTAEDVPASSPTNLRYVNTSSTSVNLTWSEPEDPNGEIVSYSVMYISQISDKPMRTKLSNRTHIVLDNLLKNSLYSVYVNSKTSAGEGPSSKRFQIYTDEDEPESPPLNPQYFNVTPTVVRLEWSPPTTPNGIIRFYMVYYRNESGEYSYKSNGTTAFLEYLKVYGEYWVQIAANTKYGDGGQRSPPLYVRTGEGQPGTPPLHLSYSNLTSTTAKLTWEEPAEPNGIITHYEIEIAVSDQDQDIIKINTTSADTEFIVSDLTPDTLYTFKVRALTKHGDGGQVSDPMDLRTYENEPYTAPRDLAYENISSTVVRVTWKEPEVPNGEIQFYDVYYNDTSLEINGLSTELDGLSPFTTYNVSVSASTSAGEGPTATLLVYTEEDEPSTPPRQVTYSQISSTEISLTWLPPLTPNGIIISYVVEYSGKGVQESIDTNQTSAFLSDLEKFAKYSATVSAYTTIGNGNQYSPEIIFQTLEDAPSDPPRNVSVETKTSTTLELSWLPPKTPNGIIQFYTIYLEDENGNQLAEKVINRTNSFVDGLKKYTWYNVYVTASTGLGDGNQTSETLRVRTLPGVPESGVENLKATAINSTTVSVSWSAPVTITGVMSYLVDYVADDEEFSAKNTEETKIIIAYLEPFKEYTINVTVWEDISNSPGPVKSVVVKTLEDAPSEPVTNLRISSLTHNTVTITWDRTPKPNGLVTSHIVDIPRANIMKEIPVSHGNNMTISGLARDTEYMASVSPKTNSGNGPAAYINFTTSAGVPDDPPTNVQVSNVQAHSAELSWLPPQSPNGLLTAYKLVYYKVNSDTNKPEPDSEKTIDTESADNSFILTSLDAYTTYSLATRGSTALGDGPLSEAVTFTTHEDVPGPPLLSCSPSGDSAVDLEWRTPLKPNGVITYYKMSYHLESSSASGQEILLKNSPGNRTITDLLPHSYYVFTVWAATKLGDGPSVECRVKTDEGHAAAPHGLHLVGSTSTTLTIKWLEPTEMNGQLSHYEVHYKPPYECFANGGDIIFERDEMVCKTRKQSTETTLITLRNFGSYSISVGAVTGAGLGQMSPERTFTTEPGVPTYEPRTINATDVSSTAVNVTWNEPLFFAGPTTYQANIYLHDELVKSSEIVPSNSRFVIVSGLEEDTRYEVAVLAITSAGSVESKKVEVTTDEDAPSDPPAMLQVKTIPGNSSSVLVEFLPPSDPNGALYEYELQYKLTSNEDKTTISILEVDLPHFEEDSNHSVSITDLLGGRLYHFRMRASTLLGFGPWTNWSDPTTLPVNPPPVPDELPDVISTDERAAKSTTTLNVHICVFSTVNGLLSNISVIVAEDGADLSKDLLHWFQAYYMNPSPPYLVLATTKPTEYCVENMNSSTRQRRSVPTEPKNFVLGQDESCRKTETSYCNGPLKSNTPYRIKLRGTTLNGEFTETGYSEPVRTHPTFLQANLYLLIGLIVGIVVIVFVVSVTVHCLRKRLRAQNLDSSHISDRSSSSLSKRAGGENIPSDQHNLSFVMEPTIAKGAKAITRPVGKSVFSAHVARMSEHNDKGFLSEFEEIESVSPYGPKNIGSQTCNASKNRFSDIIPYDHYRVKISDIQAIEGSSYINASYVPGQNSPEQYIATQCPLGHTKNDFWRMVWETGSQKIVMLCNLDQEGNESTAKYWPGLSQTTYFGNLAVQCLREERKPEWTIRTFSIAKRDKRRQVMQFHFTLWPLRGVPDNPHPFARFLHATRVGKKQADRPVVVMCSSGSGRTAVYIAVDSIIDAISKDNRVDACGVVSELRNYRPYMVQTVAEYSFIHRCLAHVISHHDTGKPSVRSPTGDGVEETTMF